MSRRPASWPNAVICRHISAFIKQTPITRQMLDKCQLHNHKQTHPACSPACMCMRESASVSARACLRPFPSSRLHPLFCPSFAYMVRDINRTPSGHQLLHHLHCTLMCSQVQSSPSFLNRQPAIGSGTHTRSRTRKHTQVHMHEFVHAPVPTPMLSPNAPQCFLRPTATASLCLLPLPPSAPT